MPPLPSGIGGISAGPALLWTVAAPTAAVALGTGSTTILTTQVPAVSMGVCDVRVSWGVLTLGNTGTAAASATISFNVGGTANSNLNGQSPNFYLGAASASGSVVSASIVTFGYNVQTTSPFTCTLAGLGSATGINAYLNISGYVYVEGFIQGQP